MKCLIMQIPPASCYFFPPSPSIFGCIYEMCSKERKVAYL